MPVAFTVLMFVNCQHLEQKEQDIICVSNLAYGWYSDNSEFICDPVLYRVSNKHWISNKFWDPVFVRNLWYDLAVLFVCQPLCMIVCITLKLYITIVCSIGSQSETWNTNHTAEFWNTTRTTGQFGKLCCKSTQHHTVVCLSVCLWHCG